jgi:hypothetical protein
MKKIYKEALAIFLDKAIAVEMPQFIKIKISQKERKGTLVPADHFIYEKKISGISFYLHFIPLDGDILQLEIGWSEFNIFPASLARMVSTCELKEQIFQEGERLIAYEACYFEFFKMNPNSWDLWNCVEPIPYFDPLMKNDEAYAIDYHNQYKRYKDAHIAESLRKISPEEAIKNIEISLFDMTFKIKECVFPIFDKKLMTLKSNY